MAKIIVSSFPLIGRLEEANRMQSFLQSSESELVLVIGRRRVGKTFLIKKVYEKNITFHLTGIKNISKSKQLNNFVEARNEFFPKGKDFKTPTNWLTAFSQLKELLGKPTKKKKVIFFDELPWLCGSSPECVQVLAHFWNTWAVDNNVVVVLCGSATTWMITNIINDTGGLHNRVTQRIYLQPFTLAETELYFATKKIQLPRASIVQLYMTFGGIPFYLNEIQNGQTAVQNINAICFGKKAPLYGEFNNLYQALFKNYQDHLCIIRALAKKWKGLTRAEIITATKLSTGGGLTDTLQELEDCNFVQKQIPFGKKQRETLYRLVDEYSLFYLKFIEDNATQKNYWIKKYSAQETKIWQGFAFESLCIKHIEGIKIALGIAGIYTEEASFVKQKNSTSAGCQIDMLIDRADNAINICEMKYYASEYTLTEQDIKKLEQKKAIFETVTKSKKQLFTTLITANGLYQNKYVGQINHHFDMNVLFLY